MELYETIPELFGVEVVGPSEKPDCVGVAPAHASPGRGLIAGPLDVAVANVVHAMNAFRGDPRVYTPRFMAAFRDAAYCYAATKLVNAGSRLKSPFLRAPASGFDLGSYWHHHMKPAREARSIEELAAFAADLSTHPHYDDAAEESEAKGAKAKETGGRGEEDTSPALQERLEREERCSAEELKGRFEALGEESLEIRLPHLRDRVTHPQRHGEERASRPADEGVIPRYMSRWSVDGRIFGPRRRSPAPGGTVLIDGSGSMGLGVELLVDIVRRIPAARVAVYAGKMDSGFARSGLLGVVADKGLVADRRGMQFARGNLRGNAIDHSACMWLCEQPGPRYLVTDWGWDTPVSFTLPMLRRAGVEAYEHPYDLLQSLSAPAVVS